MTITLDAETVALAWSAAEVDVSVGTSADSGPWWAQAVDRYGEVRAELPRVEIDKISRRQNQHAVASIAIPRLDVDAYDAVDLVECELQIFRGESLRFWGPVLAEPGTDTRQGMVPFGAAGFLSHFGYRLVGGYRPWSRNYIQNSRFDEGLARWLTVGAVDLDTATFETGSQSALLEGDTAAIWQSFGVDLATKFQLVVTARVRVESGAAPGRGLEVSVPGVQGGDQFRSVPVTEATPNGAWTTLLGVLQVEGRVGSRTVTVEVFDVEGDVVKVDHVSATIFPITSLPESSPAPVPQVDQAQVIRETIMAVNRGLHLGVSCPDTGQLVDYEPDEDVDRYADEIVRRYSDREHGVDWSIEATPFTRTFTTYYPRMGRDITPEEVTLRVVAEGLEPRNLSGYRLAEDASKAVSEVTTVGDGDYRGVYQDPEAWGGLLLQSTQKAPEGTPLADLEGLSRKALRASLDDVTALTVTVSDGELIGTVRLGDRVLVVIDHLAVQVSEVFRVVARDIDVPTDSMQLTLNVEPV